MYSSNPFLVGMTLPSRAISFARGQIGRVETADASLSTQTGRGNAPAGGTALRGVKMLAAVLFASTAMQTAIAAEALPLPPTIKAIDGNNVDLIGGALRVEGAKLSIGTEESGMRISRGGSTSSQGYREYEVDDYSGVLNFQRSGAEVTDPSKEHMLVRWGYQLFRFKLVNGTYQPYKGAKGSFACMSTICTYTSVDGTAVDYDTTRKFPNATLEARDGVATKISRPDGEIITLTYNASGSRIAAASSLGWMLKTKVMSSWNYVFQLINTGTDYCDPVAYSCENLTAYPTFTNATDALGNTWGGTWGSTGTAGSFSYTNGTYVDPRGVTTIFQRYNSEDSSILFYPASISDRIKKITRGDSTWDYMTEYVDNSPNGAKALGLWRTTVYQPGGGVKKLVYWPEESRIIQYVDELGRTTTFPAYNAAGDVLAVILPEATFSGTNTDPLTGATVTGGYWSYSYDGRGNRLTATQIPRNAGSDTSRNLLWKADYSPDCVATSPKWCNKPTSITNPRNATTAFAYYDEHGGVKTETGPTVNGVQAQTRYYYTLFTPYITTSTGALQAQPQVWRLTSTSRCITMSLATCVGTADEEVTSIAYSGNNVLPVSKTITVNGKSITTSMAYDRYGNVISEDGPAPGNADTSYYFYDLNRNRIGSIGPAPDGAGSRPRPATRTTYGPDGQIESVAKGNVTGMDLPALQAMVVAGHTDTSYSTSNGLPVTQKSYGAGASPVTVLQTSYNANLLSECVAQRMNPGAYASLPASACSLGAEGGFGPDRITRTDYDQARAVTAITRAYGTSVQAVERQNHYDATGKLDWMEDASGNRNSYEYDDFGRLFRWWLPQGTVGAHVSSTTDYEEYGYDAVGNRTSKRLRNSTPTNLVQITYTYDLLNRLTDKILPSGNPNLDSHYSYDLFGRVTSVTSTKNPTIYSTATSYVYDLMGHVTSETKGLNGVNHTTSSDYDDAGNRIRLSWSGAPFYIHYIYDTLNRMTDINEGANGVDTANLVHFDYDDQGRRIKLGRGNGTSTQYHYDVSANRLDWQSLMTGGTEANRYSFTYTPAGQIWQRSVSQNGYAWAGAVAVNRDYTSNGLNQYNGISGIPTPTYDPKGNLTYAGGATYSYNAENELAVQAGYRFYYDPMHRMIYNAQAANRFEYDGDKLTAEYDSSGTITLRRYVLGPGVDEPLVWYEGSSNSDKRWLAADPQGSIVQVTNAGGTTLAINTYDEYGIPASTSDTSAGRFRYTGQQWIPELGMYYYKARIYSPTLGRFLQTDPIGYDGQVNLYTYVGNDPVNRVDPTGKFTCMNNGNGTQTCTSNGSILDNAALAVYAATQYAAAAARAVGDRLFNESNEDKAKKPDSTGGEISDRPVGPDGKQGATGGPGAGKRFGPESPETKAGKEGVECRYCKQPTTNEPGRGNSRERDHIDPKSRGGNNSPENEGDSCRDCNRGKGARNPDEWQPPRIWPF